MQLILCKDTKLFKTTKKLAKNFSKWRSDCQFLAYKLSVRSLLTENNHIKNYAYCNNIMNLNNMYLTHLNVNLCNKRLINKTKEIHLL